MEPPVPSAAAPTRHDMPVPVCLSALYFMNLRGEIIMERQYRDDVTRTMAKAFQTEIINGKDRGNVPVVNLGACSFLYRRENNVYLVAVTRQNVNAMLCFTFLNEVVALFKSYFNKVSEKSLKNNFVVIYELLDEICDHGYPQITSAEVLKSYITQKSVRSKEKDGDASYAAMEKAKAVSMQVTGRGAVASGGSQVQEERGLPGRGRERVDDDVAHRDGAARVRDRGDTDEVFFDRHAGAEDWVER